MPTDFSHRNHIDSYSSAMCGIIMSFKTQPNFKIIGLASFTVVFTGFCLKISPIEWLILILTISLVTTCEMINTSLEAMVDLITKEWHQEAKIAKDVGGGMVLASVFFSIIIGAIIFFPKLLVYFTT